MPVYWTQDEATLPLPDWVLASDMPDYDTRMAQLTLLLRPAGLKRLRTLLAKAGESPLMVPCHTGWRAMTITTVLDVLPKPGGWLRVCFDVMFDAPVFNTTTAALTDFSNGALDDEVAANTHSHCTMAAPA
jgi:hypothetical protein